MIAFLRRLWNRVTTLSPATGADKWHGWMMFFNAFVALIGLVAGVFFPDRLGAFGAALSKFPPQAFEIYGAVIGLPTVCRILSSDS